MIYLGVDPGMDGAVAFLGDHSAQVYDMADREIVLRLLREHPGDITLAMIEDCHAFPKINATTNFKMGCALAFWEGVFAALLIPCEKVAAGKWQRTICGALPKGRPAKKKAIAEWAARQWPGIELRGPRGAVKDGRSDALCIARYGQRLRLAAKAAGGE